MTSYLEDSMKILLTVAMTAMFTACVDVDNRSSPNPQKTGGDDGALGMTTESLSQSQICNAVTSVASMALNGVPGISLHAACAADSITSTSYLGSATVANFPTSSSRAEAQALYCAVQAADGHNAIAQFDTPLGKMGMQSRVAISRADPANLHVTGQRVGTLVAFGLNLDLESQTFDMTSPTEHQPAQQVAATPATGLAYVEHLPEQTGQYSVLNVSGSHYDFGGSASTQIGPVALRAGLDFRTETPYDSGNGFSYTMSAPPIGGNSHPELFTSMYAVERASEARRRTSWNGYVAQCNACIAQIPAGGINTCDCPDAALTADHDRTCPSGCNEAFYANLSDGRLPYEGIRGTSGPFMDSGIPQNWWHFGTPKTGSVVPTVPGEPIFSLLNTADPSVATTHLGLNFGVGYTYKIISLNFDVAASFDFRAGLAVRENQFIEPDSTPATTNNVSTWIDSEGRANIGANVHVDIDLPIIGTKRVLDQHFTILDKSARSNSAAARYSTGMSYGASEPSSILDYQVGGNSTPIASCLNVPATTRPAVEVLDPHDVAAQITNQGHDKLFPCDIRLCDPQTSKLDTCTWNTSTNSMSCTETTSVCSCTDDSVSMCDSAGNVYQGTSNGSTYCDQLVACSFHDPCSTSAECGAGGICFDGCCAVVK
jgi:hypothetical protein